MTDSSTSCGFTQADVEARIAGLPEDTQKKMVCALVGHSRIQEHFWGYWYCGRCGIQMGDSLCSEYDGKKIVIIGHDCHVCRDNAKNLTWMDTFMAPDPFPMQADHVEP